MITGRIKAMLEACAAGRPPFPPNVLFNEGWLLRIVLDWFERHGGDRYPMSPLPGARWFSEAWLPSAFMARFRGDRLAESRTHADAVHRPLHDRRPGHGRVVARARRAAARRRRGQAVQPALGGGPERPVLRPGGAERRVHRRGAPPRRPRPRRDGRPGVPDHRPAGPGRRRRVRLGHVASTRSRRKVRRRVQDYAGERDAWFRDWFEPTLRRIDVRSPELGGRDRRDRLPPPRAGPGRRRLLRRVSPLQPPLRRGRNTPAGGAVPGSRSLG